MFDFDFNKISYIANVVGAVVIVFVLGKLSDYSREVSILQEAMQENKQTVIKLNSELERTNKVLFETETAREALLVKQNEVKSIKKEVVRNGKNKVWSDADLPADVLGIISRLRVPGD